MKNPADRITIPEIKQHAYFKKYGVSFETSPQTPRTTEFIGLGVGTSMGAFSVQNMMANAGTEPSAELQSEDYQKLIEKERTLYKNKKDSYLCREQSATLVTNECLKRFSVGGSVVQTYSHVSTSTQPVQSLEELREISDNEYRDLLTRQQMYKKRRTQLSQLV